MKYQKKILATSLGILLSFISINSFANPEWCPEKSVHCAHVTGLSNDPNDGRFIKVSNNKVNVVVCFNNFSSVAILNENAEKYIGANSDQYSICSDKIGSQCEIIGVDNFSISKKDDKYFAEPKYYNIDLSKAKTKYPSCALG